MVHAVDWARSRRQAGRHSQQYQWTPSSRLPAKRTTPTRRKGRQRSSLDVPPPNLRVSHYDDVISGRNVSVKFRKLLGSQFDGVAKVAKAWDMSRVAKDAEPAYWLGGFGSAGTRPEGATGIRFALIALDVWNGRSPRVEALRKEQQRAAERGRLARWAASGVNDRYGRRGEPLLESSRLSDNDLRDMHSLRRTRPGQLLYGACALATAIELQRCWRNELLDSIAIRIDLEDEVTQIAAIAKSIKSTEDALGPKPAAELAKDDQVMALYTQRRELIDERIDLLFDRVQTLNRYWDNLKNLDNEFDRLEWLREKSKDDGRADIISVEQERHSVGEVARRTEEAEGVSGAVVQSLLDDAKHILELNEKF